jgi:hypothetical protein
VTNPDHGGPSQRATPAQVERARALADEARGFLQVSGYSNERIDDLALRFSIWRGDGAAYEEFVDWALGEKWFD